MDNQDVAVIGAGSWGTALAKLLGDKGKSVRLWSHRTSHAQSIAHLRENTAYLPGAMLPEEVVVTSDIEIAIKGTTLVVMVVPSHVYREVFSLVVPHLPPKTYIVSATKGIENDTLMTMMQVMEDEFPAGADYYGVLSGPSFAKEVAQGVPTAVTVGARKKETSNTIQEVFFYRALQGV